jgi:hypothetical protein
MSSYNVPIRIASLGYNVLQSALKRDIPEMRGEAAVILQREDGGHIKAVHKIRIEVRPEGGYSVMDVTGDMPEQYMEELSPQLKDKMSLMLLLEHDSEVLGLGYRYSETVFYVDGG